MKIVKKNVYYCDFCNKKSLAAHAIKGHEKHCTANPNRECRLCEMSTTIEKDVAEFKGRFTLEDNIISIDDIENGGNTDEKIVKWTGEPVTIEEIKERFDGCPNCVLALLRQTGMNRHYFHFEFDYKKEFDNAMNQRNIRKRDEAAYW